MCFELSYLSRRACKISPDAIFCLSQNPPFLENNRSLASFFNACVHSREKPKVDVGCLGTTGAEAAPGAPQTHANGGFWDNDVSIVGFPGALYHITVPVQTPKQKCYVPFKMKPCDSVPRLSSARHPVKTRLGFPRPTYSVQSYRISVQKLVSR